MANVALGNTPVLGSRRVPGLESREEIMTTQEGKGCGEKEGQIHDYAGDTSGWDRELYRKWVGFSCL